MKASLTPTDHKRAPARRLRATLSCAALLVAAGLSSCSRFASLGADLSEAVAGVKATTAARQGFVYSPYKYLPVAFDRASHMMSSAVAGTTSPVVGSSGSMLPSGAGALTWAFATGECGAENWEDIDAQRVADANVAAFERAGVDYIISTGGAAGIFTCGTDAGMERFIARYDSPRLIGIDFDIEAGQTAGAIEALAQRVRSAQFHHPRLRFSFTLATLAASDGSLGSLNALGEQVLQAIRGAGVGDYYVNLMVMDYGAAIPGNCVVIAGVCNMAKSAIQAAENVHARYGIPMHRIELTPMIGVNDVTANVFTLDNALLTARFVRARRLGGLHFWSLDRDAPCAPGEAPGASPVCNTHDSVPRLAYTRAFRQGIEARAELEDAGHFPNTVERR
ncbi:MAG TPA: glycosyl hydrolase [Casimicrobiaceae bacterium]|nr:glycosyl hydrolase [Casimicrobiaceae bacterium]